jgi:HK97 family phage prohead protease
MSETLQFDTDIEAPETGLLHREFAAEITATDGRTVDVVIVPYGETIQHNDGHGGVPRGEVYREEWIPGAFAHQLNAANRVVANVEHERGIAGIVGHGLALRESPEGLHGSFKIHKTPVGDTALELINDGVLSGVSLEARPRRGGSRRTAAGVIQRVKADLVNVAFTRFGAYKGAKVLAVREEADIVDEPRKLVQDIDPELIERCRRLGLALPQRYQAHPDPTDTPDESGTSELGTRQTDDNTEQEQE